MRFYEQRWLQNYHGPNVLFYRRYVDDTFCVFDNEHDAKIFFNHINNQHPNIKFAHETVACVHPVLRCIQYTG